MVFECNSRDGALGNLNLSLFHMYSPSRQIGNLEFSLSCIINRIGCPTCAIRQITDANTAVVNKMTVSLEHAATCVLLRGEHKLITLLFYVFVDFDVMSFPTSSLRLPRKN